LERKKPQNKFFDTFVISSEAKNEIRKKSRNQSQKKQISRFTRNGNPF